jgi:N-acetylglutamate synthase-like GNAT family acetyltransferase
MTFHIRPATLSEIPALQALIATSARQLQTNEYTPEQIEAALGTVYGVDTVLVEEGTYFVAVSDSNPADFAGCGGWSKHKTLFGGDHWTSRDDELLDPATDAAKVRAFFVNPIWARRGVGTALLDACEAAAREAGFRRAEMGATLTGVKLFSAHGYRAEERISIPVGDNTFIDVVRMEKPLTALRLGSG